MTQPAGLRASDRAPIRNRDRLGEDQRYRMAGLNLPAAIVIHRNTVHLVEAAKQGKHVGLTVESEILAHILLTGEYRRPKRQ